MSFVNNIKAKLSALSLKRTPNTSREVMVKNISAVQTLGILYRGDDVETADLVQRYVKHLKERKIKVKALGYFDAKELPEHANPKLEYDFFCKKDLNLLLHPESGVVNNFIDAEFDVLIDANLKALPYMNYIVQNSKAHWKIGVSGIAYDNQFDLCMSLEKDVSVRQLMKHIDYYLHHINKLRDE